MGVYFNTDGKLPNIFFVSLYKHYH